MTAARSTIVAVLAFIVLIGAHVGAGGQHPRGLMSRASDKGCTIETRPLSFGYYDPLAATAVEGLGQVIYVCGEKNVGAVRGPVKNIRITMSRGVTNSYSDRAMTSGQDHLYYNVYLDATHRTIWGDGTNGTDYYFDANPPNKTPVTVPVFGRIDPLQDVEAGQYADLLEVTILF